MNIALKITITHKKFIIGKHSILLLLEVKKIRLIKNFRIFEIVA
jgi:hypothetical protein